MRTNGTDLKTKKLIVVLGDSAGAKELASIAPAAAAVGLKPVVIMSDWLEIHDVYRTILAHGDSVAAIVLLGSPHVSVKAVMEIAPLAAVGVHQRIQLPSIPDSRYLNGTDIVALIANLTHIQDVDESAVTMEVTPPPVRLATAAA